MVTKVEKKMLDTKVDAAATSVRVTRSAFKVAAIATALAIAPDVAPAISPDEDTALPIIWVIMRKIPLPNHPQEVHLPPH